MIVSRLRTSLASSAELCAPASSILKRRLAAALPALISISNAANRSSPRASRFFALRADFAATRETITCLPAPCQGGSGTRRYAPLRYLALENRCHRGRGIEIFRAASRHGVVVFVL